MDQKVRAKSACRNRTRVSAPVCLLLVCCLLFKPTAWGQSSPSNGGEIPPALFGITLLDDRNWPTVSFGALGKGTLVNWSYSEPGRGIFNWANLDQWVSTAQARGLGFLFSNDLIPPWTAADASSCRPTYQGSPVTGCTSTVANIQDWDDFVTALVTRYKGRIQIYELWNEPQAFTGSVNDMVTLTTHEYNIIRAIDPAAVIVSPSGSWQYMDSFWAAGGVQGVDAISLHAYPDPASGSIPEKIGGYLSVPMKSVMTKYGLSAKPLWDTEGSWGCKANMNPDLQAAFVARYYLMHWSVGLTRFYWYAWDSPTCGTLSGSSTHPAAIAYQQVYDWMVGAVMTTPCAMAPDSTWTCGLTRPNGSEALVIWNASSTMSYVPPSRYTRYRDLSGQLFSLPVGGSVPISAKPILLEDTVARPAPVRLNPPVVQ
jgi:Cellulase (glycosyl hydrolase family 5)